MHWIFIIVTLLPFLGYGIDGFYQKNMSKAIYTVGLFFVLATIAAFCTKCFGLYFVFTVPLIILLFILICKSLSKKE
jgi:hypothetical protein